MRNLRIIYYKNLFLLFLLSSFSAIGYSQKVAQVGPKAARLLAALQEIHYKPVPPDSLNTPAIIESFMGRLDPKSIYFINEDKTTLLRFCDSLKTNISKYSDTVVNITTRILAGRLNFADSLLDAETAKPLNFFENEVLEAATDPGKKFESGINALIQKWKKVIKARILDELLISTYDSTKNNDISNAEILQKLPEALIKVNKKSKYALDKIRNHPESFEIFVQTAWMNAIASTFDPHTEWFTPDQSSKYQESISTEIFGFGISFSDNDEGEICIDGLQFGSPAWLDKGLEPGDKIIGVKVQGKDYIDLAFLDCDALAEIIDPPANHRLEFTIRKKNNQVVVRKLTKRKIEVENLVRSFVLTGDYKIGYIYIPGFYTGFEVRIGGGCTPDLMKELIKLEEEKAEGLILDLRGNTGGSLMEAAEMAGIFIDSGSMAVLKHHKVPDDHLIINKQVITTRLPVVVLIDNNTASAAELLAGVLQIYNRAIIAGQNSFGKFTGQIILPLDESRGIRGVRKNQTDFGLVKATIQKTYLANGTSMQGTGLSPQIKLPYLLESEFMRENKLPFALKADTINPEEGFSPGLNLPADTLAALSEKRIADDLKFRAINKFNDSFGDFYLNYPGFPLHIDSLSNEVRKFRKATVEIESVLKSETTQFEVSSNRFDKANILKDDYKISVSNLFINQLKSDVYIKECYQVMRDWLRLQNPD